MPQPLGHRDTLRTGYQQHLAGQAAMCARLEAIADSLPARVDMHECHVVADGLARVVEEAQQFEHDMVFPLLSQASNAFEIKATLARLNHEHLSDATLASQLGDELHEFAAKPKPEEAERLGWMIRAFFESLRRHIAFEREHVLPLLEKVKSDDV